MRIRSLTMKDFRGFEEAMLDLDRPLTVLFGVNGSGKSSVLFAGVIALSAVLRHVSRDQDAPWIFNPDDTDIRRGAKALSLTATLSNGDVTNDVVVHHHRTVRDVPILMGMNLGLYLCAMPRLSLRCSTGRHGRSRQPRMRSLPRRTAALRRPCILLRWRTTRSRWAA